MIPFGLVMSCARHLNVGLVADRKSADISRVSVGLSVVMEYFKVNTIIVERMGIEGGLLYFRCGWNIMTIKND